MKSTGVLLWSMIFLKLVTLVGALLQTAGVVGFFAFDLLKAHKWSLVIAGTLIIIFSEGASYLLNRWMAARIREKDGS